MCISNPASGHGFVVGKTRLSSEHMTEIEDIKNAVARLHAALHIDDHKVLQEQELQDKLEQLQDEIEPFEQVCSWAG